MALRYAKISYIVVKRMLPGSGRSKVNYPSLRTSSMNITTQRIGNAVGNPLNVCLLNGGTRVAHK